MSDVFGDEGWGGELREWGGGHWLSSSQPPPRLFLPVSLVLAADTSSLLSRFLLPQQLFLVPVASPHPPTLTLSPPDPNTLTVSLRALSVPPPLRAATCWYTQQIPQEQRKDSGSPRREGGMKEKVEGGGGVGRGRRGGGVEKADTGSDN